MTVWFWLLAVAFLMQFWLLWRVVQHHADSHPGYTQIDGTQPDA